MSKYLYGASIQGIQSFIFQTNKLKEIVGGSELVEEICNGLFKQLLDEEGVLYEEDNVILQAAGNIKYEFQSKQDCEKVVLKFQKKLMEKAPGITVSQAVVVIDNTTSYGTALQDLEDKLRIQRNKSKFVATQISSFMIAETARRTGGIGVQYTRQDEVIDATQQAKLAYSTSANKRLYQALTGSKEIRKEDQIKEMEDMLPKELDDELDSLTSKNRWIAVVHADGNNLGKKLIAMYSKLDDDLIKNTVKIFSKTLDKATKQAAQNAYAEVIGKFLKAKQKIPVRPIIIGGDDLTVVIRGDLAVPFTNAFLKAFEERTKILFKEMEESLKIGGFGFHLSEGLSACAGIAFIKAKYPFHYGAELAEVLCAKAKRASKGISKDFSPSSLDFLKVQSSFIEEIDEIISKELTARDGLRFDFGPYFIQDQNDYATIDQLSHWIEAINRITAPKANIREWLGTLRSEPVQAAYLMERILENIGSKSSYRHELDLENPRKRREDGEFTHLHDVVSLSNI